MTTPDFLIVGAPRSGTTALWTYLREHPSIFMPNTKECHFFADDLEAFRSVRTQDEYIELFHGADSRHLAVGEASAFYMASAVAGENIRRFRADMRLIVALRHPVDMLHSLHAHLVDTFHEDERDFEEAWQLQAQRRQGRSIPRKCLLPSCLQYATMGCLGEQLQRLLAVFPREQVHTMLFEDFIASPQTEYEAVLRFLNVPADERSDFPRINETERARIRLLGMFLTRQPAAFRKLKEVARKCVGKARFGRVAAFWHRRVFARHQRAPLRSQFRENLTAEFRDDIRLLSELLDRDLSCWL